jgi:chromosome segregation ATPase
MTEQRIEALAEKARNVRRFAEEAERREDGLWGGSPAAYWRGRLDGLAESIDLARELAAAAYDGDERRRQTRIARDNEAALADDLRERLTETERELATTREQLDWTSEALAREAEAYDRLHRRYEDRGDVLTKVERELVETVERRAAAEAFAEDLIASARIDVR